MQSTSKNEQLWARRVHPVGVALSASVVLGAWSCGQRDDGDVSSENGASQPAPPFQGGMMEPNAPAMPTTPPSTEGNPMVGGLNPEGPPAVMPPVVMMPVPANPDRPPGF